ncbi:MAG: DsbA family protein [Parcubacteria group bacterium]
MIKNKQTISLAIALSLVALVLSVYASIGAYKINNEETFNEKVEVSIDAYVAKKQAEVDQAQNPTPTEPVEVSMDDDAVKGDDDAPITMIEFSDFECPFCGRYFRDTLSQIQEKYIDTGKIKYVFRDYPLGFHQYALSAAIAAECVRAEGGDDAYYTYHDTLFANQTAIDSDSLKSYASDMGYDIADCLDSEEYADEVQNDFDAGYSYGVRGTPAFFINGRFISGAQPYASFESVIEEELAK